MKKILLFIILFSFQFSTFYCQTIKKEFSGLKGDYFGQKPPDLTPEIFLPEVFNTYKYLHGRLVFSPDGKEVFWVVTTSSDDGKPFNIRAFIKQKNDGTWENPVESFFSIEQKENGPSYSFDGKRLYYQSRASLTNNGTSKDIDIWYREREGTLWGSAQNVGVPVNSDEDESQPWIAADGSLYFCRDNKNIVKGKSGDSDIYYSKFIDGKYLDPIVLGPEINSEFGDTEPTLAPDNSYIVFMSNRPGGFSRMMNLFVSFRTPNGGWTKAICISHELKIENIWFPTLSYDGKYLFFCGGYPVQNAGYSNSYYYWVSTDMIKNLNPYK
ncbi:MAG: hypothetical protein V1773_19275 [bacterium]